MADNTPHTDTYSMGSRGWRNYLCRQAVVSRHSSLLESRLPDVSEAQLRREEVSIRRGAEGSMPTADLIASVTVIFAIGVLWRGYLDFGETRLRSSQ